ncbi:S24 family peptidase [Type-D symbiont of Plautia stali]|uniref:LexA family protein n=1 Tax=Type-D symbiont of Plautia stali TaxID=1560356 RepID=UPI00073EF1E1
MENKDIRKANLEQMLKKHLASSGNTKASFADLLGISASQFSQLLGEKSVRNVGDKMARKIEASLGLSNGWLDSLHSQASNDVNISNPVPYSRGVRYPVLSKVQAGAWAEACEPYTLKDIDLWLESDAHLQGDAFWLEVEGDSMTAPMGLSIPEGTFVLFDTGREAANGNLVIAKLVDDNEATFKKLVIDGNQKYLKGLNPQWPMTPINGNCKIIGVAIETKLRLL